MAEIFEEYAGDLLREFGGSPDRALAAAKAVAAGAAGIVGYPMLWRQAALAVELCQRAAEMAGEVLPGSLPARQPGQHCPAMTAAGKATALAAAGVRAGASAANGYGFCAAGPAGCRRRAIRYGL